MEQLNFKVNEIFRSLQGEGMDSGSPALFVRLAGCNRSCAFCDTAYNCNETYTSDQLIEKIVHDSQGYRLIVFTGGEPLLQPITKIIPQLKSFGFYIGLETNGTVEVETLHFNSLSLSPKVPIDQCHIYRCHSLKILYPYLPGVTPEEYKHVYAGYRFIQPIRTGNHYRDKIYIREAVKEVLRLGNGWRLGLQLQRVAGFK